MGQGCTEKGHVDRTQKMSVADKLQKATSAIQVLVLQLDEEIQAGNDKVPRMEIDTEGQNAIALKDLARAMKEKVSGHSQ